MPVRRDLGRPARAAVVTLGLVAGAAGLLAAPADAPFLAESDAAMARMMSAMEIKPSGDVDSDFVAMMMPHHQGAIDMAKAQLRYGRNEILRRMAQEIIVTQSQEIAAMRLAIGEPTPASTPSGAPARPDTFRQSSSPLKHQGYK